MTKHLYNNKPYSLTARVLCGAETLAGDIHHSVEVYAKKKDDNAWYTDSHWCKECENHPVVTLYELAVTEL